MTREYAALSGPIVAAVPAGVSLIFIGLQLRRNTKSLKSPMAQATTAIESRPATSRAEAPASR